MKNLEDIKKSGKFHQSCFYFFGILTDEAGEEGEGLHKLSTTKTQLTSR